MGDLAAEMPGHRHHPGTNHQAGKIPEMDRAEPAGDLALRELQQQTDQDQPAEHERADLVLFHQLAAVATGQVQAIPEHQCQDPAGQGEPERDQRGGCVPTARDQGDRFQYQHQQERADR